MTGNIDEVRAYLNRIGKIPLLKANEEIELGKQVKRMMSCLEMKDLLLKENPLVTDEEWAKNLEISVSELEEILIIGKRAKEKMVKGNLRLVVAMAKKHQGKGLELLDLVSEGNLGLIRAVEKFEVDKGYKFSTYAYYWIRQAIVRAIFDKGRMIRVPVNINEEMSKLKKVQLEIRQKSGRSATVAELAERLEIPESKVRLLREIKSPIISLDQKVQGDEENSTLLSFLADPHEDLGKFLETLGNKELVEQCLCGLKPKEQKVLREYYLETPSLTLKEIAKTMNLTRERVRQIKNKALHKLRQVIVTEKKDESEIISVDFESKKAAKSRKFKEIVKESLSEVKPENLLNCYSQDVQIKTEVNLEEATGTAKLINPIKPSSQSVKIEEGVNFSPPMVTATPGVKVAEKSSKPKAKREAYSTTVHPKVVNNSAEKISETKETVKNKKKGNQSKVKRKSSAKSKVKEIPSKSEQREIKKQLHQLSYGK